MNQFAHLASAFILGPPPEAGDGSVELVAKTVVQLLAILEFTQLSMP